MATQKNNRWAKLVCDNHGIANWKQTIDKWHDYLIMQGKEQLFIANSVDENKSWLVNWIAKNITPEPVKRPKYDEPNAAKEIVINGERFAKQWGTEIPLPHDAPPFPTDRPVYWNEHRNQWQSC